ncbi:unnamed protein product [Tilletia controversa]|nr:unnamed protein product [Tilletia caries]CAD6962326.1 unnamed protein product [Tilletia controversa]
MSTVASAWDASLARLSLSLPASASSPSNSLATTLRQVDLFFTPTHTRDCAWKAGHSQVQSHLDSIVSQGCQHAVVESYLKRFEPEAIVEQTLQELYELMQLWRAPLHLEAFGDGSQLLTFDILFGRLLRASLSEAHLDVISELMRRLINRIARSTVTPAGSFVPSSPIWIHLGIADIALTSLITWTKRHLKGRIQALASADFSHLHGDELTEDPLAQSVLAQGPFAHRVLPVIHTLLRDIYGPILRDWLEYFAQYDHKPRPFGGNLDGVVGGLCSAALETLSAVRSKQVFDMVMAFPHSHSAMLDLKGCLHLPDSREVVIAELTSSIRQRLLHPGVKTSGIILTYLRTVSALRLIDESGVILSRTAPALRRYLRSRTDTVSVIVTALVGTDPDFESLRQELRKESADHRRAGIAAATAAMRRRKGKEVHMGRGGGAGGANAGAGSHEDAHARHGADDEGDSEEFGHFDPEHWKNPNWQPRPVDAGLNFSSTSANDIVNMLVSIFDEEAHFVTALERSTAAELIKVKGYAPDKEYRNNVILKKRFGEVKLARCDVMLNDFSTSHRINIHVHEHVDYERKRDRLIRQYDPQSTAPPPKFSEQGQPTLDALHPLIVSRQFWPSLEDGLSHEDASVGALAVATSVAQAPGAGTALGGMAAAAAANRPKLGMMKMPGQLGLALDEYAHAFTQVKSTRKVHWLGGLGSVEVELEMEDGRVIREECTPAQAAVVDIAALQASQSLPVTTQELVLQLEADKAVVTAALRFWTDKGVLRELEGLSGTFEVVENRSEAAL